MNDAIGTLSIVGTPIGNLEDMSFRAVRVLKEADLIAAEDTRHSIKLLNHFDVHTKMIAYHKFNEKSESEKLCGLLSEGKNIALISDAGMPVISDPGFELVRCCREKQIPVTVIPGPNAALSAVVLSGMDCSHFTFFGFIGKSNKEIQEGIDFVIRSVCPVILYETPHRLNKILALLAERIPDRPISISREITKQYEETRYGTASELALWFEAHPPKGEFVLVIDGWKDDEVLADSERGIIDRLCSDPLRQHFSYYCEKGLNEKEAMKAVAKDRGISRRAVYAELKVRE